MNSPDGIVYNKSRVLYGLWLAKREIQRSGECYVAEGYMDVISMYQAGIENIVGSCGTSLTKDQARLIHRFADRVVLVYDGDAAGNNATSRAIGILLEEGLDVRVIELPDGHDPDSYIKEFGKDGFETLKRKGFVEYKMGMGDKKESAKEVLELIGRCGDELYRNLYVKELEEVLGVKSEVLLREIEKRGQKKQVQDREEDSVDVWFDNDYEEKELLRV